MVWEIIHSSVTDSGLFEKHIEKHLPVSVFLYELLSKKTIKNYYMIWAGAQTQLSHHLEIFGARLVCRNEIHDV